VATVQNLDWPSKPGLPPTNQRKELIRILDIAKNTGLNAVILQVRSCCDAMYPSTLEPWSEYLTGKQGRAPEPLWDPLKFAVHEAHERGLELHAWFNPFRASHPSLKGPMAASHVSKVDPGIVKSYGKFLWLDPGEHRARKRSLDVILDVVKRYDVDGVHYDDYFYPYPVRDADGVKYPFPDDKSYAAYNSNGGSLGREDWRRHNVDRLVESIYKEVKKAKPWVKVGISPFGIYRPGIPPGIKAGIDQYADLYADCLKWLRNGWCDYFSPQLYWPIDQTPQSYPVLLNWWVSQNPKGRHIVPGNYTYKVGSGGLWTLQEVLDQIQLTRDCEGASGNIHFRVKAFVENRSNIRGALAKGLYDDIAVPPALHWLRWPTPASPKVSLDGYSGKGTIRIEASKSRNLRWVAMYAMLDDGWKLVSLDPQGQSEMTLSDGLNSATVIAFSVFDRAGNESPRTIVRFDGRK